MAGKHYPRSIGEFSAWFGTDAECLDYLEWLRWPDGFVCMGCGHAQKDGISALSVQGATVITDGWQGYRPATWRLYTHERIAVRGAKASDLLPGVHRSRRWRSAGCLAPTRAPSTTHT